MIKIIKGKRYDTETAMFVGEKGDLDFGCEKLYQKRTGEFFLYGWGGAGTKYAEETIKPISLERAKRWGKKNLTRDEYEKIFGKVEPEKVTTSISLKGEQMAKIKAEAVKRKMTVSELIGELIDLM